ncbi:MAG TPA: hypothetical protein VEL76_08005 [Gemmataceae bacterium]|nr:hypothetical protein [Gemmataceae bacterium]
MLSFPYLSELLVGPPPPSLPSGSTARWRPLVPVRLFGSAGGFRYFPRALLDTGADDSIFPLDAATALGVTLKADVGQVIRWRGQQHALRFGDVELELADESGAVWRWPAVVGFSPAPIRYPLLGNAGCLGFLDATFRGHARLVELQTTPSYPGTTS